MKTECPHCKKPLERVVARDYMRGVALVEVRCPSCPYAESGYQKQVGEDGYEDLPETLAEPPPANLAEPPGANL